jgi:hypothetical protein
MLFRTLRKSVPSSLFLRPPECTAFPNRERDWLGPTRVPITDIYIGVSAFATPASRRGARRSPESTKGPRTPRNPAPDARTRDPSTARASQCQALHGT